MTFDIALFRSIYPQFSALSDTQLEFMFNNALIISGIEDDSRIPENQKQNLVYMLVCHLATLATRGTAGAMLSAQQGDVHVAFGQMTSTGGGDADWYNLTPCGSAYWQAVKRYRLGGLYFKGRRSL